MKTSWWASSKRFWRVSRGNCCKNRKVAWSRKKIELYNKSLSPNASKIFYQTINWHTLGTSPSRQKSPTLLQIVIPLKMSLRREALGWSRSKKQKVGRRKTLSLKSLRDSPRSRNSSTTPIWSLGHFLWSTRWWRCLRWCTFPSRPTLTHILCIVPIDLYLTKTLVHFLPPAQTQPEHQSFHHNVTAELWSIRVALTWVLEVDDPFLSDYKWVWMIVSCPYLKPSNNFGWLSSWDCDISTKKDSPTSFLIIVESDRVIEINPSHHKLLRSPQSSIYPTIKMKGKGWSLLQDSSWEFVE